MSFNKSQKTATIVYFLLLVSIIFFLTPYYNFNDGGRRDDFGNLFTAYGIIYYQKLFIEIGLLTIGYCLSIIFLKNNIQNK